MPFAVAEEVTLSTGDGQGGVAGRLDTMIALLAAIEAALPTGTGQLTIHVAAHDPKVGAEVGLDLADARWAN